MEQASIQRKESYINTCMLTYTYIHIHAHINAYIQIIITYINTYIHTYKHTYIHTYTHTYILHTYLAHHRKGINIVLGLEQTKETKNPEPLHGRKIYRY